MNLFENLQKITESEDLKTNIKNYIEDEILQIEDNLAIVLASKFSEYDPNWCPADNFEVDDKAIDNARNKYIEELIKILFQNK